jgi:thiaminase/transcriptional activator TenA
MSTFTERAKEAVEDNWKQQLEHPFVRGIGSGDLAVERFKNWIHQDYVYLKDFARIFAWATAKAPSLDQMSWYTAVQDMTLNTEMALHREYAEKFGVTEDELEATKKWPTTQAYTDFLVRTAADGDLADLVAVLLPCAWGYAWIGRQLEADGLPDEERYAEWIRTYASEEFQESAEWLKQEMDSLAEGCTEDEQERLMDRFLRSSEYELRFWEMCYQGEEPLID